LSPVVEPTGDHTRVAANFEFREGVEMSESPSFVRIGPPPNGDGELAPWPWNANDRIRAEGMKPVGAKSYEGGGLTLGKWACDKGAVEIQGHAVDEACFILSGSVTLTDSEGRSETFSPAKAFCCSAALEGFGRSQTTSQSCSWQFRAVSQPAVGRIR
jgi:uncharacterized cupin superfamily protein